jgi:hypothetical protein
MPMPKNYIKKLEYEKEQLEGQIKALEEGLTEFRCHIDGQKFQGVEADGGRKDWISTRDVADWIENLRIRVRFGGLAKT